MEQLLHGAGQIPDRLAQARGFHFDGKQAPGKVPRLRQCLNDQLANLRRIGSLGELLGLEFLFERPAEKRYSGKMLAKPIMNILTDSRLHPVAALHHFLLENLPVRHIPDHRQRSAGAAKGDPRFKIP